MSGPHSVPITTPDFDAAEVLRRKEILVTEFGSLGWKGTLKKILPEWAQKVVRSARKMHPGLAEGDKR